MTEVQYRDVREIRDVVERFERCDFALAEFTHARHLTVACWYLSAFSREDALDACSVACRTSLPTTANRVTTKLSLDSGWSCWRDDLVSARRPRR